MSEECRQAPEPVCRSIDRGHRAAVPRNPLSPRRSKRARPARILAELMFRRHLQREAAWQRGRPSARVSTTLAAGFAERRTRLPLSRLSPHRPDEGAKAAYERRDGEEHLGIGIRQRASPTRRYSRRLGVGERALRPRSSRSETCKVAIYTRKSMDERLERASNTLESHREVCRIREEPAAQGLGGAADPLPRRGVVGGTLVRPTLDRRCSTRSSREMGATADASRLCPSPEVQTSDERH